jgi:hypothetical protein
VLTALSAYAKSKVEPERVTGQTIKANEIDVVEAMAGMLPVRRMRCRPSRSNNVGAGNPQPPF